MRVEADSFYDIWTMKANNAIKWSVLRRIGNLPLMRAVMFAPVIAYLILFNDYVIKFLNQVSVNSGISTTFSINTGNVYYLYYGLIFVGIASIVYSFSCPSIITRYPDGPSFAQTMKSLRARSITLSYLDNMLDNYLSNVGPSDYEEKADFPEHVSVLIEEILVKIYLESDIEGCEEIDEKISTGAGYYSAWQIANTVCLAPKATWAFSEPYRELACTKFASDILFVKYEVDDYSFPSLRFLTACLYGIGFLLLLIPSVLTFLSISIALF